MKAEDLSALDMNRILQIYKDRFADLSDFTFIFVGSFDEQQLKSLCEKYLANLPAKGRKDKIIDTGVRFINGKNAIKVYQGQDEKSIVQMTISGECKIDETTSYKISNLRYLLDEKLRENIRESRSGVYYVGAWDEERMYPVPFYQINIYMQCSPDRVDELSGAVVSTLDSLKTGLIDNKYVNVIKNTRQKKWETDITENRWWLDTIHETAWNDMPLNKILDNKNIFEKLTAKELRNEAKQYLIQDKNLTIGILYPASKAGQAAEPK
jgi:zinc protease